MTARHFYRNDGGTMEAVDAVLRWSYQGSEKANEGEAGTWEAVVDDPGMTLDFVGHRRWIVYEDESDDENELLLDGITQATRIAHSGGDVTNPTGRVWIIEIADLNTLFTYRVMTGSDSQRPEETDIERVLDIIDSEEMGYVDDLTYVSADDPTDMDEANVRGQTTGQVFDQAAQESSKNYWLGSYGTIDDGATMFAFYDHDSSDAYPSPLALSNDPADLDMAAFDAGTATVLPIGKDTELRRDYARVYDGAYGAFQGGAKYIPRDENPDPPNITVSGRDIAYPAPEVKSRARMKARLLRVLARHETPDQVIKTTLFGVHARQATMVRKGMRIATTATHLPSYESPGRYLRVLSAQPKPVGQRYDIALELQGPGGAVPPPPWTCPLDPGISGTEGKTYPPLNGTVTDDDGNLWYTNSNHAYFPDGHEPWNGPHPNEGCHGLGFASYGTGGSPDSCGANVSEARFVVAGPGTLTWHMAGTSSYSATVFYHRASGQSSLNSATSAAGTDLVIVVDEIPGDADSCYQWVDIGSNDGGSPTSMVIEGVTWAPA